MKFAYSIKVENNKQYIVIESPITIKTQKDVDAVCSALNKTMKFIEDVDKDD